MQANVLDATSGTSVVALPATLHVTPRVDRATIYQNKSLQRCCAPLSFSTPVTEVRVMVPMPQVSGGRRGLDEDSVQVELGDALNGKVILASVLIDEVDRGCLRSDGTVQIEATHVTDVASASDSDMHSEGRGNNSSSDARREMEWQLQEVRYRLQHNEIALAEAESVRDYTVNLVKSAVNISKSAPLMRSAALHDPHTWSSHLGALDSARREHAHTKRELLRIQETLETERRVLETKLGLVNGLQVPCDDVSGAAETTVAVVVLTLRVLQPVPAGPGAMVYVSCVVPSGRWGAVYEAHLNTRTSEVMVYYSAEVLLECGEDLRDVSLTLSSAVPRRNATLPPTMNIWRCGAVESSSQPRMPVLGAGASSGHSQVYFSGTGTHAPPSPAPMMMMPSAAQAEQVGTGAIVNFCISNPQTVMANGKVTRLPLTVLSLPASISYLSVPEKSLAAFTQAHIKNTSDFLLLAGDVAMFLDGNYVVQSRIDKQCAPGDSLSMFFGADPNVEIQRVLLRQTNTMVQSSYFNGKKRIVKSFTYRTIIRNKKRPGADTEDVVRVKLVEHIPTSDEEQLQVRLVMPPKPQDDVYIYDDEEDREQQRLRKSRLLNHEGIVEIERAVHAGGTAEVLFSFEVEAPSDVTIYGL